MGALKKMIELCEHLQIEMKWHINMQRITIITNWVDRVTRNHKKHHFYIDHRIIFDMTTDELKIWFFNEIQHALSFFETFTPLVNEKLYEQLWDTEINPTLKIIKLEHKPNKIAGN